MHVRTCCTTLALTCGHALWIGTKPHTICQPNWGSRCAVITENVFRGVENTPSLARATCYGRHCRVSEIMLYNFYIQVLSSKEDRVSVGRPVPKLLSSEDRPHGRPAAHTKDFPLYQKELARPSASLVICIEVIFFIIMASEAIITSKAPCSAMDERENGVTEWFARAMPT